jgi:FkbM family methyltransferase
MPRISNFIPESRLKQRLRINKAKVISRCIPEGRLKTALRLWILSSQPSISVPYLLNSGDIATIVGTPNPSKIELMSHCVGSSGRIILIEPEQKNLEKHYSYIALRDLRNITVVPKAAFDRKGKAKFLIAPRPADHRIVIPEIEHDNDYRESNYYIDEIDMDVDTIDNIMCDLNVRYLDYIEIMVNGAEMHILRGMENMLAFTQRLYIKGHARYRENKRPIHQEIIPFLEDRGFRTKLTLPDKSVAQTIQWGNREGDVFVWKETQ